MYISVLMKYCFIVFILMALIFVGCDKGEENDGDNFDDPIASFDWTKEQLTNNRVKVYFSNSSQYADHFRWEFGDGTAHSSATSPSHVYPQANYDDNEFLVVLTATDTLSGKFSRRSRLLTIKAVNSNQ